MYESLRSGRFHRLMSSNALVLKSTMFPEWYSERVVRAKLTCRDVLQD